MQFKAISDEQRIPDTADGTVDIVAHTMTITCDRLKMVDFSSVYFEAHQKVLVLKNSSATSLDDLHGQKVCATRGSDSVDRIRQHKAIAVQVPYWTDCLVLLQQGSVAAISTDDSILDGLAAQDPWTKIIGKPLTDEPYGLAISKQHPEFVRFVNAVLQQLRTDGQWKASYAHWLGTSGAQPAVGALRGLTDDEAHDAGADEGSGVAMSTCTSCGGTIEDGYCNVCGLAAAPAASAAYRIGPRPGSAGSGGSGTAGSGTAGSRQTTGTRGTRGSRRTSGRSARGRLGAGLVEIPPVPYRDPASAILADPQVPESRRFCASCEQPVGRGQDGRAGLTEGFCRNCGTRFSFSPKLEPGDLVAGQYEVLGCLAFGGLGWIYLARDHNVSDRWVVLKGLLNTGDADAMAAAVAERQFLAQVEHPNIVRIYNFVQHADRRTGESAGYIVMEYVGGKSLKQILQDARRDGGSVPLAHAIAYAVEVLPALGYLHDRGLVYCDFKPDNVIQTEEQLKLIDMGGVRGVDSEGPIYGTVGYQAPEIGTDGPSVSSDLFTVARALAVLTFEFRGYQSNYKFTFPDAVPLLEQQESFARLLRRATHPTPSAGSVRPGRWPSSSPGCSARCSRPPTARPGRPSPPCSAPSSRRSDDRRRPPPGGDQSAALAVPPAPPRSSRGCRCRRWTGPTRRPATWPRSPGSTPPSERPRCPARSRATRPCPPRSPPPPRRGWRWRAPSSTSATTTEPGPRWPTWPPRTRPTGGSPGPTACAGWLPGKQIPTARGRRPHGARSARSTTTSPASSRPSSRWPSRPKPPGTPRPPPATSSSSGPWTGRASAPRSAWPGPAWRPATGPARSRRSRRYRRRPATTRRRRSPRSGSWCHPG